MSAEGQCGFVSAAGFRCHRLEGHDGGHAPYPPDWDLPADLASVLRDQSVIVPQDASVFALIGDAPMIRENMSADCPFCDYGGPSPILKEYEGAYVIAPINPVTKGHVLVIPHQHCTTVEGPDVLGATMACAATWVVTEGVGPCNLIASHGLAATQTVSHLHVHVVPRRAHDGLALPWSEASR